MNVITYNNIIWKMYRCDNEYICTKVFEISQKTMKYSMDFHFWTSRVLFFVLFRIGIHLSILVQSIFSLVQEYWLFESHYIHSNNIVRTDVK